MWFEIGGFLTGPIEYVLGHRGGCSDYSYVSLNFFVVLRCKVHGRSYKAYNRRIAVLAGSIPDRTTKWHCRPIGRSRFTQNEDSMGSNPFSATNFSLFFVNAGLV